MHIIGYILKWGSICNGKRQCGSRTWLKINGGQSIAMWGNVQKGTDITAMHWNVEAAWVGKIWQQSAGNLVQKPTWLQCCKLFVDLINVSSLTIYMPGARHK